MRKIPPPSILLVILNSFFNLIKANSLFMYFQPLLLSRVCFPTRASTKISSRFPILYPADDPYPKVIIFHI